MHILRNHLKRLPGPHRWYWLGLSLFWLLISRDTIFVHPLLISSFGIPYIYAGLIPAALMLFHFLYPAKLTWMIIILATTMAWLYGSLVGAKEIYALIEIKYSTADLLSYISVMLTLYAIALSVFWLIRPREMKPRSKKTPEFKALLEKDS